MSWRTLLEEGCGRLGWLAAELGGDGFGGDGLSSTACCCCCGLDTRLLCNRSLEETLPCLVVLPCALDPITGRRGEGLKPAVDVGRTRSQHNCSASSHFLCRDAEAISVWHAEGGRVLLRFVVHVSWPGYYFLLYLCSKEGIGLI